MKKSTSDFYLVHEHILPDAVRKTIRVKALLKSGDVQTINEAVRRVDLSRSAYYKYKDHVFPFYEASYDKTVALSFLLEHKKGVLSSVLNAISKAGGSVLTINQGIPSHGLANVTLFLETMNLSTELESLVGKLRQLYGVKKLVLVGQM